MARRDYTGNAVPTTITAGINSSDLSIDIAASTGWPSGGANGKFFVTINRGESDEERVLISSRTGTTLTIAAVGDRGVDDTSAQSHTSGATIEHTYSAVDADEANQHKNDTALDDHTQYLNAARHATAHGVGGAIGQVGLIGFMRYSPAAILSGFAPVNTSTDISAANLVVTFDVPASGNVIIRQTAAATPYNSAGASGYYWTIREGGSDVGVGAGVFQNSTNTQEPQAVYSVVHHITGLTPGASKTYKWGHWATVANSAFFSCGKFVTGPPQGDFPAIMEVYAAP